MRSPSGVDRLIANPSVFVASCVSFQLRPLCSTGITRLHRSYGPLRHPQRPSLPLTRCQLIAEAITAGASRDCCYSPVPACRRHYPGRSDGTYSLVLFHPRRPSRACEGDGSCITRFGACSAFTHVTAYMLAKSPKRPSTPEAPTTSFPLSPL
jgi:hypothetical protein